MSSSTGRGRRSRRLWRAAQAAWAAGIVVALFGLGGAGAGSVSPSGPHLSPSPPGGGGGAENVSLEANDSPAFSPSGIVVPPGTTARFMITNVGDLAHSFTLCAKANATLSRAMTPAQVNAFFASNGTWANVSLAPHSTSYVNLSVPATAVGGAFEFVSVLPYQFQAGMFGFVNVSAGASGPPVSVSVQGTNSFSWLPGAVGVNATTFPVAVSVEVSNAGSAAHTWVLSPFPDYNLSSANFTQFFAAHPALASVVVPTTPGEPIWANFTVKSKGVYEFICTIPGHFANGMFGFLYVGVPVPGSAAGPSTDIVQSEVLMGAGGLLGIGVVLALGAAFVGRFPKSKVPPHH